MSLRWIDQMTAVLVNNGVIKQEEEEIYAFGMRQLISHMTHMALIFVVGFCTGTFAESAVFALFYIPLRIHAGGYHADTNTRCFLSSLMMLLSIFLLVRFIPVDFMALISFLLILVSAPVILKYAPVGSANKPLDDLERRIYKIRANWVMAAIVLTTIFCFVFLKYTFGFVLALSLFAECVLIIAELRKA